MDLSASIVPKSDQVNAEDLLASPVTVTVESVSAGNAEQPVNIHLIEFPGRAFRPSKTVRRVLVAAWGPDASAYVGRRMTLYRDPNVKWAGEAVGGIRVSHLSDIEKPLQIALTVTRGKRALTTVQPLAEAAAPAGLSPADIAAATDVDALRAGWKAANPTTRKLIEARVAELTTPEPTPDEPIIDEPALDWPEAAKPGSGAVDA